MSSQQEISPSLIKELRDRTGVSVSKCKEALVDARGDIEEAINLLRKKGMASAVKKEGRATNEGMVVAARQGSSIAILEGNAETDFVVRNEKFQAFLSSLVEQAAKSKPASLAALLEEPSAQDPSLTVDQYRATLVQAIGENIQVRRYQHFDVQEPASIGIYSHLGGKILTVVVIQGSSDEDSLARDIAMHAAAAAPDYLDPASVPAELIAQERDIAASQIQGKPANIVDKIVDGKINAFYDGVCLVRQKFIKNDAVTIEQLVETRAKESGKPLKLVSFLRWAVGS